MPKHKTDAYKDGQKWVVFCVKCGAEEENLTGECSERYVKIADDVAKTAMKLDRVLRKNEFVSGLPLDNQSKPK